MLLLWDSCWMAFKHFAYDRNEVHIIYSIYRGMLSLIWCLLQHHYDNQFGFIYAATLSVCLRVHLSHTVKIVVGFLWRHPLKMFLSIRSMLGIELKLTQAEERLLQNGRSWSRKLTIVHRDEIRWSSRAMRQRKSSSSPNYKWKLSLL